MTLILFYGCQNSNISSETATKGNNLEINEQLPQIAILGTFHFSNTNDLGAVQIDSIFSEKRQKELDYLIDKISKYNPTKILIEWEPERKAETDTQLKEYLEGNFKLKENEVYQVAFRLAKKTGIKELYPIDYRMNLGDKKLQKYITENDKTNDFQEFMISIQDFSQQESEFLKNNTLLDYFKRLKPLFRSDS